MSLPFGGTLGRRFGAILLLCALNLVLFALLRLAFWIAFHATAPALPASDLAHAVYLGLKFDLRLAILLVLPMFLLSWAAPLDPLRFSRARLAWLAYGVVTVGLCALVYLTDFAHYAWLDRRIDFAVLEHAHPLSIAAEVVWETYPVVWAAGGLTLFLFLYAWLTWRLVFARAAPEAGPGSRGARLGVAVALTAAFALGINGTMTGYPLRWSHAFFTPNTFASALALNPVLYLADTWSFEAPENSFDLEAVRAAYPEVAAYLGIDPNERDALDYTRRVEPEPRVSGRPNVVVILMESLGANKVGAFGNALDPTPNLDAIARESLLFTSFFVAARGTARAVFSLLTGIPDVTKQKTASRNPALVNQHVIVSAFEGYEKLYLYTGSLTWGNIRGLLQHNIADLRIFEKGDYASPRNDGWGISDMHLFEEANAVFRSIEGRPFFAFIQTSGNHRPYTIPDDRGEFREVAIEDPALMAPNAMRSTAELNSVRFMDYSLGRFFELARREDYFENTIFVMLGDHGSQGAGIKPLQQIGLTAIHVPLVIYGPKLIPEARRIDTISSSLDVLPTLAGLVGIPYINRTLGRDILQPRGPGQDFVFSRKALVDPEFYLTKDRLYRYRSDTPAEDVGNEYPEHLERAERRRTALYETARYLLHHNH